MKQLLILVIMIVTLTACSKRADVRVATYNIRYAASSDATTGDGWAERKGDVANVILTHDFDIVGTQEATKHQIADLQALLPAYDCTGHPYSDNTGNIHNATIFYKRDKLELLSKGTFWYSPTPDVESIGWDATDLRLCHWGKFRDKASGKEFFFFNSHLYWRKHEARANSGKVHIAKVQQIAGDMPVVSVGDFNSVESEVQIQDIRSLLGDAYHLSATTPQGSTDTNLGGGNFVGPANGRIDFVFVSPSVEVKDYRVLEDKRENGHYPSDHLPIVCNIRL